MKSYFTFALFLNIFLILMSAAVYIYKFYQYVKLLIDIEDK